jgi:hypothetical protein
MLLGDYNAKAVREDIFKSSIGSNSLHEISNDNVVRGANFAVSSNLIVKSTFPRRYNHKYTWTSPGVKTHKLIRS